MKRLLPGLIALALAAPAFAATAAKPTPAELQALADRGSRSSAVTTGEKMQCLALWSALTPVVKAKGLQGLPESFGKDLPKRVKTWAKLTKAAYKKNGQAKEFDADLKAKTAEAAGKLNAGDLRWVADWGGSCLNTPKP